MDLEAPFEFKDLFFSRTDSRGIILSGNSVFKNISGYDWDSLINKPHNIIRHRDMPRAVFYLLWKTIQNGDSVGAYVKNMAKDRSYYWVFALVTPINGNYVSIRLKPSSTMFEIVKNEYQKVLDLEKEKKISPEHSYGQLISDIIGLGFHNYEEFMITALTEELKCRQENLKLPINPSLEKFQEIKEMGKKLLEESKKFTNVLASSYLLPINLTIESDKLGAGASPLVVIAEKYSTITHEIYNEFKKFEDAIKNVEQVIFKGQYTLAIAILQDEIVTYFKNEIDPGPNDIKAESSILASLRDKGTQQTLSSLNKVESEFTNLIETCERLETVTAGLEIVRLMGKIEVSKLPGNPTQLHHLMSQLHDLRSVLSTSLETVMTISRKIKSTANSVVKDIIRQPSYMEEF